MAMATDITTACSVCELRVDGKIGAGSGVIVAGCAPHVLDVGRFHALATLLRGITDRTRVHAVNVALLAANDEQ